MVLFISVFNFGCIEIAENHLLSLIKCGITNYLAYVTDKESFDILSAKGYNVEQINIDTHKEKQDFGTENFNTISYLRYKIINKLLKEDKIVWYLDVDTVVLANLNQIVEQLLSNNELVMQNDLNMPCTGCMLFSPTKKMIELTNTIYDNKTPLMNDQILFLNIVQQNRFNIKLHLLDCRHFPNGLIYFNERHPDPKFKQLHDDFKNSQKPVFFVHANWMVGIDTKIKALQSKNLWYL
jgi:hypothetical protein